MSNERKIFLAATERKIQLTNFVWKTRFPQNLSAIKHVPPIQTPLSSGYYKGRVINYITMEQFSFFHETLLH